MAAAQRAKGGLDLAIFRFGMNRPSVCVQTRRGLTLKDHMASATSQRNDEH
jgi:hypothetical protein